jgi:hypothetical protein
MTVMTHLGCPGRASLAAVLLRGAGFPGPRPPIAGGPDRRGVTVTVMVTTTAVTTVLMTRMRCQYRR